MLNLNFNENCYLFNLKVHYVNDGISKLVHYKISLQCTSCSKVCTSKNIWVELVVIYEVQQWSQFKSKGEHFHWLLQIKIYHRIDVLVWVNWIFINLFTLLFPYEALEEYGPISTQLGSIFQLPKNNIISFIYHW